MGKEQPEPSHDLLKKVIAVVDAKSVLPATEKLLLNKWDVYCRMNHLSDGRNLYQAGGKFIAKLRFMIETDGSIIIQKYRSGDWESVLEATYNHAKLLRTYAEAERRLMEIGQELAKLPSEPSISDKIAIVEELVNKEPDWEWPFLGDLYSVAGRFKDAERLYVRGIEMWPNVYTPHYHLAAFYLNALANAGFMTLPTEFALPQWAKISPNDIGYTFKEVCHMTEKHIRQTLELLPLKDSSRRIWLEKTLSMIQNPPGKLPFLGTEDMELVQARQMLENNPDEAVSRLEQIVSRNPESASCWNTLAIGYMQTGRAKETERALFKAISLDPNDPAPHLGLSTLYKAAMCVSIGVTAPLGYSEITLEALGCSYEHARKMVEKHANEVFKLTSDKEFRRAARNSLEEIEMLDNS